jgi:putative glutamine amidotransferase
MFNQPWQIASYGKILPFSRKHMRTNKGRAIWIGMPAQMDPDDEKQYLSRQYPDAIAAAGGLPVTIPLLEDPCHTATLVESLDGILLTGNNSDLDPALYGSSRIDACGPGQKLRDRMDFFLLENAMKRQIPILAICFGVQSLNVFLGGSLIQDIPTAVGASIRHSNSESRGVPSHAIAISSGSVLEQAAGGLSAMVNSTHHQAIERAAPGLEIIARAPDGVIESVCGTGGRQWILGVQWHPEKSCGYDDFSRRLFEDFLARCRAARGIDEGTDS